MSSLRVKFYTLGCKVNQYEASAMAGDFSDKGFIVTEDEVADIYVVSGCVVTSEAERKTRQLLRKAKRKNPDAIVVSVGCYPQLRGEAYADVAVGNRLKCRVIKAVEEFLQNRKPIRNISEVSSLRKWDRLFLKGFYGHTRAWVKIQDGCNHLCSYCIVPYVRGREISRNEEEVLKEVEMLVDMGFNEIVLTGVNIGRYGYDWGRRDRLAFLIERLSGISSLKRLRLSSIEPFTITERLIAVVAEIPNVCKHLHIPLQSGDDAVLKRMRRGYTSKFYQRIVDSLRSKLKDFNITTDVIVGFPGETEEAFRHTLSIISDVEFSRVHVFPFSRRPMTEAYLMKDQVEKGIVKRRVAEAISLSEEVARRFKSRFIGKGVELLVEKLSDEYVEGWAANYLRGRLRIKDGSFLKGDVVNCKVMKVSRDGVLDLELW